MIAGRRETFAIEARPLAGAPPEGDPAAAATWTALRVYASGRNLLRNINRDERTVSEDVNWPAVGLARWFARSWNELFHPASWSRPVLYRNARDFATLLDDTLAEDPDCPDDDLDTRDSFVAAHSLRAAAAGAALPDVWFIRDGAVLSIAWHDSMDGEVFFTLSRGEVDVPAEDFALAVRDFMAWVHGLVEGVSPPDARLIGDWLARFQTPDAALEGLLHEVGLSRDRLKNVAKEGGLSDDDAAVVLGVPDAALRQGTLIDASVSPIALAFRCASPVLQDADLAELRRAILAAPRSDVAFSKLVALAGDVQLPGAGLRDYTAGYHLARGLRSVLGNDDQPLDIEKVLSDLGIPVLELPLSDGNLDGGCVCDRQNGPMIFVNPASRRAAVKWGRRVILAHELCHLLFDRRAAVGIGVISGPWAPPRIERRANAFAVELLLPLQGVMRTVGKVWEALSDDDVQVLMDTFDLGVTAVTEHVRNLGHPRNR